MAHEDEIIQALTAGKLRIAKTFQIATLIAILERQGILRRPEVLDGIFARGEADSGRIPVPEPMEPFEQWLHRRVAQAIEAGDVPPDLLTTLQSELEGTRARPDEVIRAAAIREFADIAGIDHERAALALAAMEARSTVMREMLLRRITEAWLESQRKTCRRGESS